MHNESVFVFLQDFTDHQSYVTLLDFDYHLNALWFPCSFNLFGCLSILRVPDEVNSRNAPCAPN